MIALTRAALTCRRGVFAIMGALLLPLLLILLLLVIDYGRGLAARIRWQGIAEAVALVGAAELDQRPDALERALVVMRTQARLEEDAAGDSVPLDQWEWLDRDGRPTRDARDANGVRVAVTTAPVASFAARLVDLVQRTPDARDGAFTLRPTALAVNDTLVCQAAPLALCTAPDTAEALSDPSAVGRQLLLTPGEGLRGLCPPGDACSPDRIIARLAQPNGNFCASTRGTIQPLSTDSLSAALGARFGGPQVWAQSGAHPRVTRYPRDLGRQGNDGLGSGYWDRDYYWRISRGQSVPGGLAGATRYQTYLYEWGQSFAMRGRETLYPPPPVLDPGMDLIAPRPLQRPFLPLPDTLAGPAPPASRVLTIGLADCGTGAAVTLRRWLRLFVTEAPERDGLRAEIIGRAVAGEPAVYAQGRLLR